MADGRKLARASSLEDEGAVGSQLGRRVLQRERVLSERRGQTRISTTGSGGRPPKADPRVHSGLAGAHWTLSLSLDGAFGPVRAEALIWHGGTEVRGLIGTAVQETPTHAPMDVNNMHMTIR